jgi:hypothetical protein
MPYSKLFDWGRVFILPPHKKGVLKAFKRLRGFLKRQP